MRISPSSFRSIGSREILSMDAGGNVSAKERRKPARAFAIALARAEKPPKQARASAADGLVQSSSMCAPENKNHPKVSAPMIAAKVSPPAQSDPIRAKR